MQSVRWTAGETAAGGAEGACRNSQAKGPGPDGTLESQWGRRWGNPPQRAGNLSGIPYRGTADRNPAGCASVFFAARPMAAPCPGQARTERMIPMEKKTPLYLTHLEEGGKMVPFAGYLLPVE